MEIVTVSLIALGLLVLMLSFGVPLPFCFGGALMTMVGLGGASMKGTMVWGFSQLANPVLLCIPLFVFAGTLMSESGIAASLLRFVNVFVGRIRGGLGVVATVSCAIIGAISGSGLTGVAATGPILIPEMDAKGYPRGYATALVANSSILGLLIPPSVTMIIYGWVTDTSILACFLATMGPGLLITFLFSVVNMVLARKFPLVLDPPKPVEEAVREGVSLTSKAIPALIMPLIILGGIYGGIMTPTEAAAVAVIYALPVGFLVYRGLSFDTFFKAAKNSATSVGAIMVMIVFSLMLSQIFVMEDVPQALVEGIFTVTQNKVLLLILINFLLFFVGMIVNDITAIILLAPLLLPLMGAIGVSPVQFAAIMGVNTAMGGVTPPYASILYLGMRIGKVEFSEVIKPAMILIIFGYVPVVFLTSLWPKLSLFIPGLFGY
ncbi:TRAP transporter large permease [Desulfoluna spongiiphila]|uniref:TRAP transporter, DctM subunit n=1 Tax=Desulfoluna spongiiphila TaxID=419481 RepID=A0A1G5FMA9_9BACT|nr:TRAP transporter large permease [Desulfoluna spongiiphila]SCY39708.1 TRAP transporter, DctM subunit [Desulfoluna spongiiphila]VVS95555.1 trap c4-dicarboxylate transport system permease dctm subunit [Desulfoluna spongiiphila]